MDQLEQSQYSPQSQTQSQQQQQPANNSRPSSDSPIFVKNFVRSSTPVSAAHTLSVIHPNQAYIVSQQSSLAHPNAQSSQSQQSTQNNHQSGLTNHANNNIYQAQQQSNTSEVVSVQARNTVLSSASPQSIQQLQHVQPQLPLAVVIMH